jgi:hypothetical protein
MSSTLKTMAVAGTIALSVTIFAASAAYAGGRHLPFGAVPIYVPSAYDDDYDYDDDGDDCLTCSLGYGYGGATDSALSAAGRVTRGTLGVDLGDVIDEIAE